MTKKFKYLCFALMMTLLTGLVWLIWKLVYPSVREQFLNKASTLVETKIFGDTKKRRSTYRKN